MYDDAVVSFTNVLQTLNPLMNNTAPVTVFEQTTDLYNGYSTSTTATPATVSAQQPTKDTPSCSLSRQQTNMPLSSSRQEESQEETPEHFIFRDPIEIPFDVVSSSEPSRNLVNKFVVVIMYNLALSVHLSAIQYNDISSLQRARKLYELAFQMHLEESCDVTLLYSLALMNNLGLIYHVLGEEERSKTCFKNMLATMMYLLESDEAKTIKQWDGLLSNVMDRMFHESQVAAPAA
jgi:hypothetical protein